MAKAVSYEVQQRGLHAFAVLRKGAKGGTRLINVYTMEHQANDVAAKLRQWINGEV